MSIVLSPEFRETTLKLAKASSAPVEKEKKRYRNEAFVDLPKRDQLMNPMFSPEFRKELRIESPDYEETIKQAKSKYVVDRKDDGEAELKRVDSFSDFKVIVSGGIVEVWEYGQGVKYGKRPKNDPNEFICEDWEEPLKKEILYDPETGEILNKAAYDPLEAKRHNARRAKNQARRIILSNFDVGSKFITLTFRDGSVRDVTNVRECNLEFENFIKKLRRRFGKFKYFKVIEFQDKNGRGAVHYHFLSDLPFIDYDLIAGLWGHGFIGINRIKHVDNVGAYVTSYMLEDFGDPRLNGEKSYSSSQKLIRPVVLHGKDAAEIIKQYLKGKKEVFTNSYESEYQGHVIYKEFNLARV